MPLNLAPWSSLKALPFVPAEPELPCHQEIYSISSSSYIHTALYSRFRICSWGWEGGGGKKEGFGRSTQIQALCLICWAVRQSCPVLCVRGVSWAAPHEFHSKMFVNISFPSFALRCSVAVRSFLEKPCSWGGEGKSQLFGCRDSSPCQVFATSLPTHRARGSQPAPFRSSNI